MKKESSIKKAKKTAIKNTKAKVKPETKPEPKPIPTLKIDSSKKNAFRSVYTKIMKKKPEGMIKTTYQGLDIDDENLNDDLADDAVLSNPHFIIHSLDQLENHTPNNPLVGLIFDDLKNNKRDFVEKVLEEEIIFGSALWFARLYDSPKEELFNVVDLAMNPDVKPDNFNFLPGDDPHDIMISISSSKGSINDIIEFQNDCDKALREPETLAKGEFFEELKSKSKSIHDKFGNVKNLDFDYDNINSFKYEGKKESFVFKGEYGMFVINPLFNTVKTLGYGYNRHVVVRTDEAVRLLHAEEFICHDENHVREQLIAYENNLIMKKKSWFDYLGKLGKRIDKNQTIAMKIINGESVSLLERLKMMDDTDVFRNDSHWSKLRQIENESDIKALVSSEQRVVFSMDTQKSPITQELLGRLQKYESLKYTGGLK